MDLVNFDMNTRFSIQIFCFFFNLGLNRVTSAKKADMLTTLQLPSSKSEFLHFQRSQMWVEQPHPYQLHRTGWCAMPCLLQRNHEGEVPLYHVQGARWLLSRDCLQLLILIKLKLSKIDFKLKSQSFLHTNTQTKSFLNFSGELKHLQCIII